MLHRIILESFTVFSLVIAAWHSCYCHQNSVSVFKTIVLEKNKINISLSDNSKSINKMSKDSKLTIKKEIEKKKSNELKYNYVIKTGDTLSNILNHYGINIGNINKLTKIDKDLHNLKIGQQLSWTLTADGDLRHLTWKISHCEIRIYDRVANGFKINNEIQHGDWINSVLKGTVGDSFVSSAQEVGLTFSEINAVIKAMEWQIDFHKLRRGDEFAVQISREILGSKQKQSRLVSVHLRSNNKDYYAIRAEDGNFYDRNGISFTEGFLRFPTSRKFRASSKFNLSRINPVTGRVTPHRGVDFAMPQGTPVLAVGDGEVTVAKLNGTAGYYIVVSHGHMYTTRYMHLCKLLVQPGQKVKRGDCIALSGNTGRSTGPHLHYEIWINQQAINPLTAKLPCTKGLTGKDRTKYLAQVKKVIPKLCFHKVIGRRNFL